MSWLGSDLFEILSGEPAMTIVPNLLKTGILTIAVSLVFLVWAPVFVGRKHGGLVLILLSGAMLLVGGGFGPPILGVMVGVAATRINAPLRWWGTHLSRSSRRLLARLWPWCLLAGVTCWLLLLPGTMLLDLWMGVSNPELLVGVLTLCAFGFLLLTILAGFAHDVRRQIDSHQTSSETS